MLSARNPSAGTERWGAVLLWNVKWHPNMELVVSCWVFWWVVWRNGIDYHRLAEGVKFQLATDLAYSPELTHVSSLYVMFWTFFFIFSLFHIILASNCLVICKMFSFWQYTRLIWSRDWPRPKLKEMWSLKSHDLNLLKLFALSFKTLTLPWFLSF